MLIKFLHLDGEEGRRKSKERRSDIEKARTKTKFTDRKKTRTEARRE
jgi:hypothetical protein